MTLPTWEKTALILVATPGMIAPAASATNPAISAYSMRSCPVLSHQSRWMEAVRTLDIVICVASILC